MHPSPMKRGELSLLVGLTLSLLLAGHWLLATLASRDPAPRVLEEPSTRVTTKTEPRALAEPPANRVKKSWIRAPAHIRINEYFRNMEPLDPPAQPMPPIPPDVFATIARAEKERRGLVRPRQPDPEQAERSPLVNEIIDELQAIPDPAGRVDLPQVKFPAQAPAGYERDARETPLRLLVVTGQAWLRGNGYPTALRGSPVNVAREAMKIQRQLAADVFELRELSEEIRNADWANEKSKRWQALGGYVRACLLLRHVYLLEYNQALGSMREGRVPALDLKLGHKGWQLAHRAELTLDGRAGEEARSELAEAHNLLDAIIKEHPGTPYAVMAQHLRHTHFGLEWQPTR